MLSRQIRAARGLEKADLVLKNGKIINVFSMAIQEADVAICEGMICGIGTYEGKEEVDCTGKFISPGFIDGHIHIESAMLHPSEFCNTVLPHGTTAVVTDPHEIANVCGCDGLDFMLDTTKDLPLDVYFVLPSCVPSSLFDESGALLEAKDLKPYYANHRVLGLAELMDYEGTISGKESILQKVNGATGKIIDGHAPGLTGKNLCAYLTAGVMSDHECTTPGEALERIRLGQWVMIREGTAAKNLEAMIKLFEYPYAERCMLVTDDRHAGSLLKEGHIDYIIRKAIALGADPIVAIKMATYQAAVYFELKNKGAVAPNYQADLVILSDLKKVVVDKVYKRGKLVAEKGKIITDLYKDYKQNKDLELPKRIYQSFCLNPLEESHFMIKQSECNPSTHIRAIGITPYQITTKEHIMEYEPLTNGIDVDQDILKLAVIERHKATRHIGLGFIHGYGLKQGAIASSVSHDSHNLIVVGTNEKDMSVAANCVREMEGGFAVTCDGKIVEKLALPLAGLMSHLKAEDLAQGMENIKEAAVKFGVWEGIDPFMTLAFVSLPVIPELRLTTLGLINVSEQTIVSSMLSNE